MKKRIECHACTPEGREKDGCGVCGGYGFLIEKRRCQCGNSYWSRPGNWTIYTGKRYHSFDGTPFYVAGIGNNVRKATIYCHKCPKYPQQDKN